MELTVTLRLPARAVAAGLAVSCSPMLAFAQEPQTRAGRQRPNGTAHLFRRRPDYRGSNPVISSDGRYMAFQTGRSGVAAGTGYGIFLYDFEKAEATDHE